MRRQQRPQARVVPTHVGVNRAIARALAYRRVVPTHVGVNRTTPSERAKRRCVVPTHVGVNRAARRVERARTRGRPHARGGEPLRVVPFGASGRTSSPRTWG